MPRQTTNVFIGGLNRRVVEKDIDRFFQNYQNIQDIALKDGFCFVKFGDYREAEDACYELNGRDILGDRVKVEIARGTPFFEIQTQYQWIQFGFAQLFEIQTQHPLIQLAQFIETFLKSKHDINGYNLPAQFNLIEIQTQHQHNSHNSLKPI